MINNHTVLDLDLFHNANQQQQKNIGTNQQHQQQQQQQQQNKLLKRQSLNSNHSTNTIDSASYQSLNCSIDFTSPTSSINSSKSSSFNNTPVLSTLRNHKQQQYQPQQSKSLSKNSTKKEINQLITSLGNDDDGNKLFDCSFIQDIDSDEELSTIHHQRKNQEESKESIEHGLIPIPLATTSQYDPNDCTLLSCSPSSSNVISTSPPQSPISSLILTTTTTTTTTTTITTQPNTSTTTTPTIPEHAHKSESNQQQHTNHLFIKTATSSVISNSKSNTSISSSIGAVSSSSSALLRQELGTLLDGPWSRLLKGLNGDNIQGNNDNGGGDDDTMLSWIKLSYIKLAHTLYDIPTQIDMYRQLQIIIKSLNNQNSQCSINSSNNEPMEIGIDNYYQTIFNNNHLMWNIKNVGSFITKSPLLSTKHYQENINGFRIELNLIINFYKQLVNDLVFQLCFVPYLKSSESNNNNNRKESKNNHPIKSYHIYSRLTIYFSIKILTDMKIQFEHLENHFNQYLLKQQQQQPNNQNNQSNQNNQNNNNNGPYSLLNIFNHILSSSIFLNHYQDNITQYYYYSTLLQRFTMTSLSNFAKRLRLKIINDKLFQLIYRIKDQSILFLWMMGTFKSSQQYYLNSCNPAAFNLSYLSKSPHLAPVLFMLKEILSKLENYKGVGGKKFKRAYKTLTWHSPTILNFMESKIEKVTKLYNSMYSDAMDLVESISKYNNNNQQQPPPQYNSIFQTIVELNNQWNRAMQSLSSIFSPSSPRILTKKPIDGNWHSSAYLMTIYCSLTMVLPGQPKIFDRLIGTPPYFFESMMMINYDFCFPKTSRYFKVYDDFQDIFLQLDNDADRLEVIDKLWDDCHLIGGVLFCSSETIFNVDIGHLNYLFSIHQTSSPSQNNNNKVNEKVFLIGDPEYKEFKIINFKGMEKVIGQKVFYFTGPSGL